MSGIEVVAYPLGCIDATNQAYAWAFATELSTKAYTNYVFVYDTPDYYVKGRHGYYLSISNQPTAYGGGTWYPQPGAIGGVNATPANGLTEIAVPFYVTSADYYIITGGSWYFKGQSASTPIPAGNIIFNLYVDSPGENQVLEMNPVVSCKIAKSNWAPYFPTSDFWVDFVFSKPFVFGSSIGDGYPGESGITLGMVLDAYTGSSTTDFVSGGANQVGTYYIRGTDKQWITGTASSYAPVCMLHCVELNKPAWFSSGYTGYSFINNGLFPAIVTTTQRAAPTGQTSADLTELDIVIGINGLKDVWGNITAGMGDYIEKPHDVIRFLSWEYDASLDTWGNSDWDWTTFSSLYSTLFDSSSSLYRIVAGCTDGDVLAWDVITEISKEMCCKLVQRSDTCKLALLPWGSELTAVKVFTDENCEITGWFNLGDESVINNLVLSYDKNILNYLQYAATSSQGFENYAQCIRSQDTNNQTWVELSQKSVTIFGNKETENRALNWINDVPSANSYMRWILSTFDLPHRTCTIRATLKDNATLNVGDVVEILSSRLPAYYGTSSSGRKPYFSAASSYQVGTVDINNSYYMNRAQRYRAQIVERSVSLSASTADVNFTCRILRPYHTNDPT